MTERPFEPDDDGLLAAEFALGVLQGSARDDFAKRVSADPALAAQVRYWNEHFAGFTDEIAPVLPSAQVQRRIENRLFGATQRQSIWNSLGLWRGLAIASLAALLAVGVWNLQTVKPTVQDAFVARVEGEAKAVELVAYYDAATGELRLNRTAGAAATNRSFELWLIVGSDAPVSLGVLPAANTTRLTVPVHLRSQLKGSVLAISDEPAGGSPTGAPTGPVLATGQLTAV